jgi:hypothetical protein
MVTRRALLTLVAVAIALAAPASPVLSSPFVTTTHTEFGSVCGPDCPYGSNNVAAEMHVHLVRLRVDNSSPGTLQQLRNAASAGDDVEINMADNCTGTILPDALWQAKTALDLAAAIATGAHIVLVVPGNEWDLETGCDGPTYIANVTEFATIAHARGLTVADGGVSSGGVNNYYQYVVNRASPRNMAQMNKIRAFMSRVSSTGIDLVNVHWYEGPANLATIVGWYGDRVAKPLTSNEWGVLVLDGATVTDTAQRLQKMGVACAIAYVRSGPHGAVGFYKADGTLNANGKAYQAFNKAHSFIPRARASHRPRP